MGVSSIGSAGYTSTYTPPLSSGPTVSQATQQADQTQQLRAAEESRTQQQTTTDAQAANAGSSGGGNTTPTRGQNLNITV